MRSSLPPLTVIALLGSLLICSAAAAQVHGYQESFETITYRDPENTTAWWDTEAGEIKLFPGAIALEGTYDTLGSAYATVLVGTYAYVADDGSGLKIIDVSDPAAPFRIGVRNTPGNARGVAVAGNHAFMADGASGLQVIDISDPANPILVAESLTPGFAHDIDIAAGFAYLAQSGDGLQVIDISNPTDPTPVGATLLGNWAEGVFVSVPYAYVADGSAGLQVVDISNPSAPALVGTLDTDGYAFGIFVAGAYAYIADSGNGLVIADISSPGTPTFIGALDTPGSARAVCVAGGTAYIADGTSGLQLVNVTDPAEPIPSGEFNTSGEARDVEVAGELAYVADGNSGLHIISVSTDGFNTVNNLVQSLPIENSSDPIVRARLTTTQVDSILWELSVDDGQSWHEVWPAADWHTFAQTGNVLRWRSTHTLLGGGQNPACEDLFIEWQKIYSHAVIDSVRDVPGDQGGQVRLHWTASRLDIADSPTPINEYAIYRRIDPDLLAVTGGRATVAYPPGDWDFIATVPADLESHYTMVVPTLADSTAAGGIYYTPFFIRARTFTPGTFFDSPPDSGYSLNNLLPTMPAGLTVDYNIGGGNQLTWLPSPDPDFSHFRIYRAEDPDFAPSPASLVHTTPGSAWLDGAGNWHHHYRVSAVDAAGNQSLVAFPGLIVAVPAPDRPELRLLPNRPNPFNPGTVIHYVVPAGGAEVRLEIFDARGQRVRVLVDGLRPAGPQQIHWQGQDSRGRPVAAGVYFCRLQAAGQTRRLKMTVLE